MISDDSGVFKALPVFRKRPVYGPVMPDEGIDLLDRVTSPVTRGDTHIDATPCHQKGFTSESEPKVLVEMVLESSAKKVTKNI